MSLTIKDQEIILDKQFLDGNFVSLLGSMQCPVCLGTGQDDLPFDGCYRCEGKLFVDEGQISSDETEE